MVKFIFPCKNEGGKTVGSQLVRSGCAPLLLDRLVINL